MTGKNYVFPKSKIRKIQHSIPKAMCKLRRDSVKFYLIDKLKPKKDVNKLFSKMIESTSNLYLLGQMHCSTSLSLLSSSHAISQIEKFFKSMKKFTYNDEIKYRKGFISDVGWGCTIRSGQMLLFNMLLFKIIQFKVNMKYSKNLEDKSINLLTMFHDNRTTNFSFSNFIEKSSKTENKKLNEYWNAKEFFMACESILEDSSHQLNFINFDIKLKMFISDDGSIIVNSVKEALSKGQTVLLVFNLNIGNEDNRKRIKKEFFELIELQFFSGLIGGHKKEAYYIFGNFSDKLLYLDPHKIRAGKAERNFDVSTYYEISFEKLNSSVTLTFTLLNLDEHLEFLDEIVAINTELLYEQQCDLSEVVSECEVSETSFQNDQSFEKVADTKDFYNVNGIMYNSIEIDRVGVNDSTHVLNDAKFFKIPFEDENHQQRRNSGPFSKTRLKKSDDEESKRKDSFIDVGANIDDLRRELADDLFIKQNYVNF